MKKFPKPWYRASRGVWYVTLDGRQHNLGPDRDEAFDRYRQLLANPPAPTASRSRNKNNDAPATYLVGLIQRFMDDVRANRAAATAEWYRYRLQLFVDFLSEHDMEMLRADELKRGYVREWSNSYPHLSSGSKRNLCRAIQRVMNWGVENDYLDHSPLAGLKKPKAGKRDRVISDAEWKQIVDATPNDDFLDLLNVTWETGCRPQESLRVEARHVDLKNSRWVFPQSESKTDLPRIVYLTEPALEITKRRMLQFPIGPMFRNSAGQPWTTSSVNCAFTRIQTRMGESALCEAAIEIKPADVERFASRLNPVMNSNGQERPKTKRELLREARKKLKRKRAAQHAPKFCLYVIRHTWMNRLLTSGVDALTVAILAGHCDPSTLAKTYQHLSQNPAYLLEQARRAVG